MSELARWVAGLPRLSMRLEDFNELPEYSASIPTGKFVGKMWRCRLANGQWIVRGYLVSRDPGFLDIPSWKPRFVLRPGERFLSMARQWRASLVAEKFSPSHANLRYDVVARLQ